MRLTFSIMLLLLSWQGALGISLAAMPLPSSTPKTAVTSKKLPDLTLDMLGTLDSNNGGLPEDMWYGSEGPTVLSLMKALPAGASSPGMRRLMARLLLTKARPPADLPAEPTLLDIRLQLLLQLGKGAAVANILSQLPADKRTEDVEKNITAALLYEKDYAAACPRVAEGIQKYNNAFWQQANIICLAIQGKKSEAELAIQLYEELSGGPAVLACCNIPYRTLVGLMPPAPEAPVKPLPPITPGNPLELPMLIAAGFSPEADQHPLMESNLARFSPLLVMEPNGNARWQPSAVDAWWHASPPDLSEKEKSEIAVRAFVIMESLGLKLPAAAWEPLPVKDIPSPDPRSPLSSLLMRLDKAAQEKKLGETVLLALVSLGDDGPGHAHAYTVARVVRALRRVGLEGEASAIATEAALLYMPSEKPSQP